MFQLRNMMVFRLLSYDPVVRVSALEGHTLTPAYS